MQMRKLNLYVALTLVGAAVSEISERLLTLAEYEPYHEGEHLERVEALAEIMSGLKPEQFAELSVPDFNSLAEWINEQLYEPEKFRGDLKSGVDFVDLLAPIVDETGAQIKSIKIKVPSLKALRLRDKQEGGELVRAIWMTSYCTGVSPDDLRKLALVDWMALQKRVGGFLSNTAANYRSGI